MQHTKKLRVIITIAFIVLNCGILITIFAKFIISCKLLDEYTRINIFEDISALDVVKTTEAELTDEYISDLSVLRSFVHGVAYNSETFEIYAYEFETVEDAKKYMKLTRGTSEEKDKQPLLFTSLTVFRLVAVDLLLKVFSINTTVYGDVSFCSHFLIQLLNDSICLRLGYPQHLYNFISFDKQTFSHILNLLNRDKV